MSAVTTGAKAKKRRSVRITRTTACLVGPEWRIKFCARRSSESLDEEMISMEIFAVIASEKISKLDIQRSL